MYPITIPYSLEVFCGSALALLVAVEWQGVHKKLRKFYRSLKILILDLVFFNKNIIILIIFVNNTKSYDW